MPNVVVLFAGGIAMLRHVAIQVRFFILERVGTSRTAVGVAMLLNHKHYFVSQRMWQNSDQYFQAANTFQWHPTPPTHTTIPSSLSFLERESGDRRGRGGAEAGRGFSATQINFVQENIIMELTTFKRSVLTQIICYKTVFMCVYVCFFAWFLVVCLFVFRLVVKPYLLQFSIYLCWHLIVYRLRLFPNSSGWCKS